MAFKKQNYPLYWKQFSEYIRFERAKNKCERCGAVNGEIVERGYLKGKSVYQNGDGEVFDAKNGEFIGLIHSYDLDLRKASKIVLTVAHLDHAGGVCRCKWIYGFKCAKPLHVRALCQSCHLSLDRPHHLAVQAKNRRIKKDKKRGLFENLKIC